MQDSVKKEIVRLWDKNAQKMVNHIVMDNPNLKEEIKDMLSKDYIIKMKYLGFSDRNGKDVYEGDIVKCWSGTGELLYGGAPITLGSFTYHNKSDLIEVVGNKWEDPELNQHDIKVA